MSTLSLKESDFSNSFRNWIDEAKRIEYKILEKRYETIKKDYAFIPYSFYNVVPYMLRVGDNMHLFAQVFYTDAQDLPQYVSIDGGIYRYTIIDESYPSRQLEPTEQFLLRAMGDDKIEIITTDKEGPTYGLRLLALAHRTLLDYLKFDNQNSGRMRSYITSMITDK